MDKIMMFIELLKLESRKANALADISKQNITNNSFSEQQKVRAAAIAECVEWAELLLKNDAENK